MMRTTINLPDEIYEIVRSLAHAKEISFGNAVAELVRKSFQREPRFQEENGFPCFVLPADTPAITLEQTLDAEDEL